MMNEEKQRTIQQNKALHKFFELVANTLNDAGMDMRAVLKPDVEIPWDKETIKTYLWKPIQKIMTKKEHTADLTTKEIDKIYEVLNRHLAERGIHEAFPSIAQLMLADYEN